MPFLAKILAAPVPVVAGAAVVLRAQFPTLGDGSAAPDVSGGPQWLMGAVAGIWLVVWLLDRFGKLPNGGVDRRRGPKFEEEDRRAIRETREGMNRLDARFHEESERWRHLHGLLTYRSGDDGIERWLKHHQTTNESKVLLDKLVLMTEEVRQLRADEQRRTGMLVSTLEAIQRSLGAQSREIEALRAAVANDRRGER